MAVTEQYAPAHSAVKEGGGSEVTALGGGGGAGGHLQGIQCLWDPPGDGDLLPMPGQGDISGGQQLYGGSQEFVKGKGGAEEDNNNSHQGGGRAAGVRIFL